jgi:thioredoxin:protein disulfide reductase
MRLLTLLLLLVSFSARAETTANSDTASSPAATAPATATADKSATSNEDEFLPPEQAFVVTLRSAEGKVAVDFAPAPGHYMYRERISFTVKSPAGATIVASHLPAGEIKDDPNFGRIEVYHHPFLATVEVARPAGSTAPVEIEANYQGCSEKGLCYPPMQKSASLDLGPGTGAVAAAAPASSAGGIAKVAVDGATTGTATKLANVEAPASDTDRVARLFAGGSFWVVIASFFGFGLLLSFTPCVFPMIPILSGIIVGQGESLTKSRATAMSASYVLGMAITYSAAGVAAGLSGSMLSH